jgi:hypothetical protein
MYVGAGTIACAAGGGAGGGTGTLYAEVSVNVGACCGGAGAGAGCRAGTGIGASANLTCFCGCDGGVAYARGCSHSLSLLLASLPAFSFLRELFNPPVASTSGLGDGARHFPSFVTLSPMIRSAQLPDSAGLGMPMGYLDSKLSLTIVFCGSCLEESP